MLAIIGLFVARPWRIRLSDRVVFLLPPILLTSMIAYTTWSGWLARGQTAVRGSQGRYLYAAIAWVFVLVAVALYRLLGRWTVPLAVAVAALVQLNAVGTVLRKSWGPRRSSVAGSFEAVIAWSPWGGAATATLLVGTALVAAVGFVLFVRDAVRRGDPVDRDVPGAVREGVRAGRDGHGAS